MPTYKKLNSSSSGDILPNVWYGGGEIFDKVSNTAFSRAVGNQTYRNNNIFLVKALFTYYGTNDAVPVITEKLQPQQEVSVQSNYTLVAVMKIE